MKTEFHPHDTGQALVIGIGELLWDLLPSGASMGGAPANFACHASALGARTMVVSRVGNDEAGERLVQCLGQVGVSTTGISVDPAHPTGAVTVELSGDGLPRFTIHEDVAWDHLAATAELAEHFRAADAVCFGTLAQRSPASAAAIRELVGQVKPDALRVLDLNLRVRPFPAETVEASLALANVVKLNEDELALVSEHFGISGDRREKLAALVERYDLKLVACTLGPDGSMLQTATDWVAHPGCPVEAKDTVGAGDSFLAAVTLGLLKGWSLDAISVTANEVAAHVCSCDGAVPVLPGLLRARFLDSDLVPSS